MPKAHVYVMHLTILLPVNVIISPMCSSFMVSDRPFSISLLKYILYAPWKLKAAF